MAIIHGTQTIDNILYLSVESDPSAAGGTPAPIGSHANTTNGTDGEWYKFGASNTNWIKVLFTPTGQDAWLLDGNSGTGGKYIGTNDANDFPIYTNGIEAARVLASNQNLGIGVTTPSAKLTSFSAGVDATTSSFKTGNTAIPNLFEIKDDDKVYFNNQVILFKNPFTTVLEFGQGYAKINTDATIFEAQQIYSNRIHAEGSPVNNYIDLANTTFTYNVQAPGSGQYAHVFGLTTAVTANSFLFNINDGVTPRVLVNYQGDVGIGNNLNPTAKLHVVGQTHDLTTYAMKLENSILTPLMWVYDSGQIGAGDLGGNLFMGFNSGLSIAGGTFNTSFGKVALNAITSGIRNVTMGYYGLGSVTTGSDNFGFGFQAGDLITTGSFNIIIGSNTSAAIINPSHTISIGSNINNNFDHSIAFGTEAKTTAINQLIFGSASNAEIYDVHFGAGVSIDNIAGLPSLGAVYISNTSVTTLADQSSAASYMVYRSSAGTGVGAGGDHVWQVAPAGTGGGATTQNVWTEAMRINQALSVIIGNSTSSLATTATDGFLYLPSCAGTPTGVPTTITGSIPMVVDSTNNKAYIYSGGAWVALN